jgi:hypothetical protein
MGIKMNKHMQCIVAVIEGLRNLDNWPESVAKSELTEIRDSMAKTKEALGFSFLPGTRKNYIRFADPLGREISLFEWMVAKESCEFHVEEQYFESELVKEPVRVSTVWLGMNHAFFNAPIQIFETMIFGIEDDEDLKGYQDRYSTLEEAELGHTKAVNEVIIYFKSKSEKK